MKDGRSPLIRLTGSIYRSTQAYTNEVLGKYNLGSGTYPFLLTLYCMEGINQNQISKELDVDKAMTARAIKKLIDLGYVKKEEDHDDARAFKLYLSEKGRATVPAVKEELIKWNQIITQSLNEQEKETVENLLSVVLEETKKYRNRGI